MEYVAHMEHMAWSIDTSLYRIDTSLYRIDTSLYRIDTSLYQGEHMACIERGVNELEGRVVLQARVLTSRGATRAYTHVSL